MHITKLLNAISEHLARSSVDAAAALLRSLRHDSPAALPEVSAAAAAAAARRGLPLVRLPPPLVREVEAILAERGVSSRTARRLAQQLLERLQALSHTPKRGRGRDPVLPTPPLPLDPRGPERRLRGAALAAARAQLELGGILSMDARAVNAALGLPPPLKEDEKRAPALRKLAPTYKNEAEALAYVVARLVPEYAVSRRVLEEVARLLQAAGRLHLHVPAADPAAAAGAEAGAGMAASTAGASGWRPREVMVHGAGAGAAVLAALEALAGHPPASITAVEGSRLCQLMGSRVERAQRHWTKHGGQAQERAPKDAGQLSSGYSLRTGENGGFVDMESEAAAGEGASRLDVMAAAALRRREQLQREERGGGGGGASDPRVSWVSSLPSLTKGAKGKQQRRRYDLVVAPYQLMLLPTAEERQRLVRQLWDRCGDVLVLIEPGTPLGFAHVAEARQLVLELEARKEKSAGALQSAAADAKNEEFGGERRDPPDDPRVTDARADGRQAVAGAHVVAPCPHDGMCPMLAGGRSWCHFGQPLLRPPFMHEALTQPGGIGGRGGGGGGGGAASNQQEETFSYVVLRRGPRPEFRTAVARQYDYGRTEAAAASGEGASTSALTAAPPRLLTRVVLSQVLINRAEAARQAAATGLVSDAAARVTLARVTREVAGEVAEAVAEPAPEGTAGGAATAAAVPVAEGAAGGAATAAAVPVAEGTAMATLLPTATSSSPAPSSTRRGSVGGGCARLPLFSATIQLPESDSGASNFASASVGSGSGVSSSSSSFSSSDGGQGGHEAAAPYRQAASPPPSGSSPTPPGASASSSPPSPYLTPSMPGGGHGLSPSAGHPAAGPVVAAFSAKYPAFGPGLVGRLIALQDNGVDWAAASIKDPDQAHEGEGEDSEGEVPALELGLPLVDGLTASAAAHTAAAAAGPVAAATSLQQLGLDATVAELAMTLVGGGGADGGGADGSAGQVRQQLGASAAAQQGVNDLGDGRRSWVVEDVGAHGVSRTASLTSSVSRPLRREEVSDEEYDRAERQLLQRIYGLSVSHLDAAGEDYDGGSDDGLEVDAAAEAEAGRSSGGSGGGSLHDEDDGNDGRDPLQQQQRPSDAWLAEGSSYGWGRIVRPPRIRSGHVVLDLCMGPQHYYPDNYLPAALPGDEATAGSATAIAVTNNETAAGGDTGEDRSGEDRGAAPGSAGGDGAGSDDAADRFGGAGGAAAAPDDMLEEDESSGNGRLIQQVVPRSSRQGWMGAPAYRLARRLGWGDTWPDWYVRGHNTRPGKGQAAVEARELEAQQAMAAREQQRWGQQRGQQQGQGQGQPQQRRIGIRR